MSVGVGYIIDITNATKWKVLNRELVYDIANSPKSDLNGLVLNFGIN
jgi:hypothetical protein